MTRSRWLAIVALLVLMSPVRAEDAAESGDIERLRKLTFVKERDIRLRGGSIECAAWSRDGKRFATGGETGEVLVWDTTSKKPVARFDIPEGEVSGLAFSADGKRLWVANGVPAVWNVEKQELIHEFKDEDVYAHSVTVSPDGKTVVFGRTVSPLLVVDENSFEIVKRIPVPRGVENMSLMAISPDGKRLAVSGRDGSVAIVDVEKGEYLPADAGVNRLISGIAWRADGTRVICSRTGEVWLEDEKHSLGDNLSSVTISPDGRRFAAQNARRGIVLFDENFKEVGSWNDPGDLDSFACWKNDGSGFVWGADRGFRLWVGDDFDCLDEHAAPVRGLEFSADGRWLAAESDRGCVIVNTASGEERSGPDNALVYRGAGGSTFVLAGKEGVELWDASAGKSLRVLTLRPGSYGEVCAISPDGSRLLQGNFGGLELDPLDGGAQIPLAGLKDIYFSGAEWSPDSRRFVVFGWLRVPEPSTSLAVIFDSSGKELQRHVGAHAGGHSASWSADGESLWWSGGEATVRLDATDWSVKATLPFAASWWQPVDDRLAIARVKEVCGLWHIPTGTCLRELPETEGLYLEAFAREGRRVALAGNGRIVVWTIGR